MRKRILAMFMAVPVLLATVATTASAAPALTWSSCAEGRAQCASLQVPIDHDDPDGEKLGLGLAKLPARDPAAKRGTIVAHLGGPTANLGEPFFQSENLAQFAELQQWFDVVFFDSRGYGRSTSICNQSAAPQFVFDGTGAGFEQNRRGAQAYGASCREDNPALAEHASSVDVAHDIDDIRAALGEDKIVFYGNSYGTVFGQAYADLYSSHLSRLFLDSTRDHSMPYLDVKRAEAEIYENGLDAFARWCTAGAAARPARQCCGSLRTSPSCCSAARAGRWR